MKKSRGRIRMTKEIWNKIKGRLYNGGRVQIVITQLISSYVAARMTDLFVQKRTKRLIGLLWNSPTGGVGGASWPKSSVTRTGPLLMRR